MWHEEEEEKRRKKKKLNCDGMIAILACLPPLSAKQRCNLEEQEECEYEMYKEKERVRESERARE